MQCSTPLSRQSPDAMNLIKTVMSHSITVVMVSDEIQGHLKMNSSMFICGATTPGQQAPLKCCVLFAKPL